jgi:hypothetical protein
MKKQGPEWFGFLKTAGAGGKQGRLSQNFSFWESNLGFMGSSPLQHPTFMYALILFPSFPYEIEIP